MALNYGYTIRIRSNGSSDPSRYPTNQWQRKLSGQSSYVDIEGETSSTYVVQPTDQSSHIRLKQLFDNAPAYSNALEVTSTTPPAGPGDVYMLSGRNLRLKGTASTTTFILYPDGRRVSIGPGSFNLATSQVGTYRLPMEKLTHCSFHGSQEALFELSPIFDTSRLTNMNQMFRECFLFNGNVNQFNTSKVTCMHMMFAYCYAFNQNVGNWDVRNVTNFYFMFMQVGNASPYGWNGMGVSNWNVSNGRSFYGMFVHNPQFNQDLRSWNVANARNLGSLFERTAFNWNISHWNTANCTNMNEMFRNATSFYQNISGWSVRNIKSKPRDFDRDAGRFANQTHLQPRWGY